MALTLRGPSNAIAEAQTAQPIASVNRFTMAWLSELGDYLFGE